ncbi:Disulfide bond formation protein B [Pseudomonas fluorescens]|uniref:disulfide bond formation protein B n=1 Tax=Pseudomonas fluorescens TaxID=294 RepID=UPI001258BE60|nr:disulfide bond formation protein B [Pseudomonas fluorescens]CAG8864598.1 Disulfide bond formation protein B [Pseudomonas fluorescens]VVP72451.1 Disulfide bond formation protein B [Pseudomonas fluorescens]
MPSARLYSPFLPAFVASMSILAVVHAVELGFGLAPCPLGYGQQFFLAGFSLVSLSAVCHAPGALGMRIYALLSLLLAAAGALVAGRQVWLQGALPIADICTPSFAPVLDSMPWCQAIKAMLVGSADCMSIHWSFLDLTLPEWTLLAFLMLAIMPVTRLLTYRFSALAHPGKG